MADGYRGQVDKRNINILMRQILNKHKKAGSPNTYKTPIRNPHPRREKEDNNSSSNNSWWDSFDPSKH